MNRFMRFFALFLGIFSFVPTTCATAVEKAAYFITISKFGSFLEDPSQEKLEVFRRIGRILSPFFATYSKTGCDLAYFVEDKRDAASSNAYPIPASAWSNSQREAVSNLRDRATEVIKTLTTTVPLPDNGVHLIAVLDPQSLHTYIENMMQNPEIQKQLKPQQILTLNSQVLPLLKMADISAFAARLTPMGLECELRMLPSKQYVELIAGSSDISATLQCGKYLEPDALISFAQVHSPLPASAAMEALRQFPQTTIVTSYLASAGLDFERDILSNQAVESFGQLDLTPTGDNGLPEFRGALRPQDPKQLLLSAPKFKNLATNVGVMVNTTSDSRPAAKISYFLFPTFAIHICMADNYVVFATSHATLLRLAERIEEISSGKIQGFNGIPNDVQRYWRIRFACFNEQLQRFLQSPLLKNLRIPPISNLNVTNELGDMQMLTRIRKEGLIIRLDIPTAETKNAK